MSRLRATTALFLAATLGAGCNADVLGPTSLQGLPEGLRVELTLAPSVVIPHAPFAATLSVTNTTTQQISIVTSHGCLATPHVMLGNTRIPFEGSWWGCTAAITTHRFAPGETRSHTWNMRAELYAEEQGDVDGAPAPRANYRVRAEFDVYSPGGAKPAIERILVVR